MTTTSLDRLRAHFMPKMKGTPDANMFAVLSADIDQHGLAFRDAAAKIASVDTLQAFMKDFPEPSPARRVRVDLSEPLAAAFRQLLKPSRDRSASLSQPGSPISQWLMPSSTSWVARPL